VPKDFFEKRGIFMLKSLRDGAKGGVLKFVLFGFMAMAVGGLVLTDVGGFFRGGISTNLVAKGKDIKITTVAFDRTARRILSRQGMSPQDAYRLGMINQILNSEIQTAILTREAQKLGLNVSDESVKAQISQLAEPLAKNGVSKSDALKQVLRAQGISEGEFVSAIRQEMGNTLFRNALLSGTGSMSEAQASDLYQYQNEVRNFEGFVLTNKSVKDITAPTDENLQKYYESNKMDFLIAERRDVTIATLKKEMLEDKVEISDNELHDTYEDAIETYKKPEQRKLQQAILATQNDAQDVLKRVEGGKLLKKAVKDVTGKKSAYLGENDFTENGLLEDVAKPVFAATQGAIIGPIQSPLGFHVLVLKEIIAPQIESFDKVKKSLRNNMLQDRLLNDLVEAANTLDDQLAGGAPLEEVVKEMGLTTERVEGFNQSGYNTKNKDVFASYQGDKVQILEVAFDYETGEASPVLELEDGRFITVRIDNIQERSYTPFEKVKKDLSKQWMDEQRALTNRARTEDLFAQIKSGTSLKDAAKKVGTTIKNFKKLKRDGAPKAPLTIPALRQIFDTPQNTALRLSNPEGFIIGQVTAVTLPDIENAEKDIQILKDNISDSLTQEALTQYISTLAQKHNVKINDRVLKIVYGETEQNSGQN
jgi:peptidyl-prolyl cis-trans isomerase D